MKIKSPKKYNLNKGPPTQKGFSLLVSIGLIPIFLTIVYFLFGHYQIMNQNQNLRWLCRSELLNTQTKVGKSLDSLIGLNKSVDSFIKLRATGLALMSNPQTFTTGLKIKTDAETALNQLTIYQKNLYNLAKNQMNIGRNKLLFQIKKATLKMNQPIFNLKVTLPIQNPAILRPAVRKLTPSAPYSLYIRETPFEEKQTISFLWNQQIILQKESSLWMKAKYEKNLDSLKKQVYGCQATLKINLKNNHKPILGGEISSLNPFYFF